jgi:hypothetical protein
MKTTLNFSGITQSDLSNLPSNHLVSFYQNESDLIDELQGYILSGLSRGEGCVVIATPEHRALLNDSLASVGVNIQRVTADSSYIALDAEETLASFMHDDWPDAEKFQKVIRKVLMSARGRGRNVRAFGEMVAILWDNGHQKAALRLEHLWNDLINAESFHLFCAYPSRFFSVDSGGFPDVCAAHSLSLGTETVTALS